MHYIYIYIYTLTACSICLEYVRLGYINKGSQDFGVTLQRPISSKLIIGIVVMMMDFDGFLMMDF